MKKSIFFLIKVLTDLRSIVLLNVPAETFVINAGIEVLTASASGVTLDLGDGGDVDRLSLIHI